MNGKLSFLMCFSLLFLFTGSALPRSVPLPVGWWKLDDGAGTIAVDSSTNGNDALLFEGADNADRTIEGTPIANPMWIEGRLGGALRLDGGDSTANNGDYIDLPIDDLISELEACTISTWVNWAGEVDNGWQRIFDFGIDTTYNMFLTPNNGDGYFRFAMTVGGWTDEDQVNYDNPFPSNEWTYCAVTMEPNGVGAAIHTLYLNGEVAGQNVNARYVPRDLAVEGESAITYNWIGRSMYADSYFGGAVDNFQIYDQALNNNQIVTLMEKGFLAAGVAIGPKPGDAADDILRDGVVLSWEPTLSPDKVTHDVYFGEIAQDVNDASRDNPGGMLLNQGQTETTYPLGRLKLGKTYYWRIDEVNQPNDNTIFKGFVWSFTIEPEAYRLATANIVSATASSSNNDDQTPEKTIDRSGLVGSQHSTTHTDMWYSGTSNPDGIWIEYAFDTVYPLDTMKLWNYNHRVGVLKGNSVKDITIAVSLDGETWNPVTSVEVPENTGRQLSDPSIEVDMGQVPAKYVRITVDSMWGSTTQAGISEVSFAYTSLLARYPSIEPGTGDIDPVGTVLGWRSGRQADTHKVYISSDIDEVRNETVPANNAEENSFDITPLDLALGATYYWRVNEVNAIESPPEWAGWIWNFSTLAYRVVDDFEDYNNSSVTLQRPFQTWIDGYGYSNPAPGKEGNNTGAGVGHDIWDLQSPYFDGFLMEQTYAHSLDGGGQSIPLYYDNTGAGGKLPYSEMTRTFDPPVNWSANGVTALVFFFQGQAGNTGSLYVKINGEKIMYTDDPGAIAFPAWTQWNVDLTGLDVSAVSTLSVGVDDAGATGLVLVDDMRIYGTAPALPGPPTDPGTTGLLVWYDMENNLQDKSGNGNIGTWWGAGNPLYVDGPAGLSSALSFNAISDYMAMDIGADVNTMTDFTFSGWINFAADQTGDWQRIFDIGIDPNIYMFLTPRTGGDEVLRFAMTNEDITGEDQVQTHGTLPAGWHHVAVTINSADMTIRLYQNGTLLDRSRARILPMDLGETTQNWLGRSQFTEDAFFNGSMDEIKIFNRALSEAEIRYLAGRR